MTSGASAEPGLTRAMLAALAQKLMDEGKLVESGFAMLRKHAMHPKSPTDQVESMRLAFFAGAQHVLASIMQGMDLGVEPTSADMDRMNKLHDELNAWLEEQRREAMRRS